MSTEQGTKLDDMMRKITSLLARADHPNTPEPEADSARAMAERLMKKYRIEESELIKSGALIGEQFKPGSKVMPVTPTESPYLQTYWTLAVFIAQHCGVRIANAWNVIDGVAMLTATLVGYEADIRYAEVLFQNARIIFAERMEPKPDSSLSDEDNVYRMRSAGMERIRIAKLMGYGDTTSATAKVTRLYKKACAARGEDPTLTGRDMSVSVFREEYAASFTSEVWNRLRKARDAADSTGGELVLADRKENVDEAFYSLFPHLRPSDVPATSSRKVKPFKWTAADQRRAERRAGAAGQAGSRAGKAAAAEIDYGGTKPPGRLND
jgi:hypothetical protein